jgi:predicted metal-dependent hydrolase
MNGNELESNNYQIKIEGIGTVRLIRSNKARYLRLKVHPHQGIIVIVPRNINDSNALKFVSQKKNWIERSIKKQNSYKKQTTRFTESSSFATRSHQLFLLRHQKNTMKSIVKDDKIVIWYPEIAKVEDDRIQSFIRKTIEETWRLEAKKILPVRLNELAKKHGFQYNKFKLKNAKTRWGSCSAQNNINLNIQLMRLPDYLIEYVILHELMHTKEKNHQARFWNHFEQILPGARKLDKELNQYNLSFW